MWNPSKLGDAVLQVKGELIALGIGQHVRNVAQQMAGQTCHDQICHPIVFNDIDDTRGRNIRMLLNESQRILFVSWR